MFWMNVIFNCYIVDNWQDGIYYVVGIVEDGQCVGDERCYDRNIFWVMLQQFFGNLQYYV